MALYELLLPRMGESVAEATIIKWLKVPGEMIEPDDAVVEIATDKVDSEVSSPVKGKLSELLFKEDEVAQVGSVIALIETEVEKSTTVAAQPATPPVTAQPEKTPVKEALPQAIPGLEILQPKPATPTPVKDSIRFYSPLVRSIAGQEGISQEELDQIPGSGSEGRLTKDDLLDYLQNKKSAPQSTDQSEKSAPANPASTTKPIERPQAESKSTHAAVSAGDEIFEMDRMRKLIADHMVISKQTSPHVTSFIEADVTNLVQWREKYKAAFEKREGEKITFTPIFVEAVAKALKDMPMVNVSVNGTQIIRKKNINIGMATALPNGNLIVPVIKNADTLNLLGLTKAVNHLAQRARNNKLQPDEVKDGTFTITNIGSFGNIMGTPIINQPQAAILAIGVIKKKPAVIETGSGDMIAIRHLMYLSLSYDHRIVDGALGGMFLKKVSDYLENWDGKRSI
ncbi:dihydrolipoamide acetyltransferase family protein [Mucilaginibacter arboris]|uniref:Dihydrolipoamide acetyltransferase component of pyruvate dehydrogenase complex n=1 Tax=Mucilaginibacter arboris TaxID=2682090 RepID=A0A7K1SXL1_9SPHI|nr:dihydrolipoamide acetyltransferase family protein [Mucilaginibacter arboris]MVN21988.1 2-oxo acid dehydrogenase subunit E2 [Mucilaginibacter arboris]